MNNKFNICTAIIKILIIKFTHHSTSLSSCSHLTQSLTIVPLRNICFSITKHQPMQPVSSLNCLMSLCLQVTHVFTAGLKKHLFSCSFALYLLTYERLQKSHLYFVICFIIQPRFL